MFICLRPRTPYPPPPYKLHTCIQYTYSHREGGNGYELNQKDGERATQESTDLKVRLKISK
jgi:hypothetical protein